MIEMPGTAKAAPTNGRNRKRGRGVSATLQQSEPKSLEAQPVIRAAQEYAKRAHSLGALQGAYEIQRLVDRINHLGIDDERLREIVTSGERAADQLRSYLSKVYGD
jgi:hypothetical protein